MCTYPHFPPIQVGTVQRRVSRTGLPSNSQCLPRHCSWCISHRWMHGQYRYWLDPGLYSNLYNILDGIANTITIHKWYYMWCWVPSLFHLGLVHKYKISDHSTNLILGSLDDCISQLWPLRVVLSFYIQRHFCHCRLSSRLSRVPVHHDSSQHSKSMVLVEFVLTFAKFMND